MKVKCIYNNPEEISPTIPNNFNYGLVLGKEYIVLGLMCFKKSNTLYFLVDEENRPGFFPFQIFEIIENRIPINWHLKINVNNEFVDYSYIMGFDELCNDEEFYNNLLLRNKEALSIYRSRKNEALSNENK
jgi:hypothetical protein